MTASGADLLGLQAVEETARLLDSTTWRTRPRWDGLDGLRAHWPDLAVPLLVAEEISGITPAGTGKTAVYFDFLSALCNSPEIFAQLFKFDGPAASDTPKPCDCPACAEFGTATECTASRDRFGSRLSFETWKTDQAAFAAPHVTALMDAPALAIADVLDEWAEVVYRRAHQASDCTAARVTSFHLISPWILLLDRLLILAWRTGAANASRRGLIRLKRRSRDSRPVSEAGTRPRCAGRAPRGPSAPRMSSMVIRGGALP